MIPNNKEILLSSSSSGEFDILPTQQKTNSIPKLSPPRSIETPLFTEFTKKMV